MCRLFAQITPTPTDAARYLLDSPRSLLKQAEPQHKQVHGWGLAFGLDVIKEPRPAHSSRLYLGEARRSAGVIVGHLRAASNPLNVPIESLLTPENTQPFTDGKWVFAHNGEVKAVPESWRGRNDSEFYFETWREQYQDCGDVIEAFKRAARLFKGEYTSLNALLTDGTSLWAVCHSRGAGMRKEALFEAGQPWQVMSWRRDGKGVLVASEPVDDGAWQRLGPDQYLAATSENVTVGEFNP